MGQGGTQPWAHEGSVDDGQTAGGGPVQTITAGNASVVVGGTPANRTIAAALSIATPAAVGPASVGTALTEARGDHSHAVLTRADAAAMSALVVTAMPDGTPCYVASRDGVFRLETSARTTNTWDTFASATAGRQWLRTDFISLKNASQAVWSIDPAAGSDDAAGGLATPLKTMSELAWRLSNALLTTSVSVTLTSSMAAADKAYFTWLAGPGGSFSISGTATVLFTGAVTTYTAAAAAPAADQATVLDSSLPVSWTASGLLANGVQCKRTTASTTFWVAKDNGAKTARISQPTAALANGNAYTASQLPTIQQIRFTERALESVIITNCMTASGTFWQDTCCLFITCWFQTSQLGGIEALNCAFSGATNANLGLPGGTINCFAPMFRGTGATQFLCNLPQSFFSGPITLQGVSMIIQSGVTVIHGDVRAYDTTVVAVSAAYWGLIVWYGGALSGTGNTAFLVSAGIFSQIGYLQSPLAVAGSSSSGTPVHVGGVADMSVAALTGGGGVINATGNGIFNTAT